MSFVGVDLIKQDSKSPHILQQHEIYKPQLYTNFSVIDQLLSSGDILKRWQYDRLLVRKFDLSFYDIFPSDNSCMNKNLSRAKQCCVGCKVMSRLTDCKSNNSLCSINGGDGAGISFIDQASKIKIGGYKQQIRSQNIDLEKLLHLKNCQSDIEKNIKYMSNNSPTENYVMISSIMEDVLNRVSLFTPFLWSYTCQNDTHIITKITDIVNPIDVDLEKSTLYGILKQLAIAMKELSTHNFVHCDPSFNYLTFNSTPYNHNIKGYTVTSPITLYINPSINSSITYNNTRFFSPSGTSNITDLSIPAEKMDVWLSKSKFNSCTSSSSIPCMSELMGNKVYGYRIGNRLGSYLQVVRDMGLPIFQSFDLYYFLLSMIIKIPFYNIFVEDVQLMSMWKELWMPSEYISLMDDIVQCIKNIQSSQDDSSLSFTQLAAIFGKYTFRCDAVTYFYEHMLAL